MSVSNRQRKVGWLSDYREKGYGVITTVELPTHPQLELKAVLLIELVSPNIPHSSPGSCKPFITSRNWRLLATDFSYNEVWRMVGEQH